jgi:hypothetical protein
MTRFDFDKITRDAFNAAVSLGIIDAVELGCLMAQHGTDAEAIIKEITLAAYCCSHSAQGRARHSSWCDVIDTRAARLRAA